jgi:hypothetical protein
MNNKNLALTVIVLFLLSACLEQGEIKMPRIGRKLINLDQSGAPQFNIMKNEFCELSESRRAVAYEVMNGRAGEEHLHTMIINCSQLYDN